MPQRAAQLRSIFEKGFDEPFVPKVWPKMNYFSGGVTGTFKEYWKKIKSRYWGEDLPVYARGVGASEGVFTVPVKLNDYNTVFIPDSNFYEFIEEADENTDLSKLKRLDELEVGKKYEILMI